MRPRLVARRHFVTYWSDDLLFKQLLTERRPCLGKYGHRKNECKDLDREMEARRAAGKGGKGAKGGKGGKGLNELNVGDDDLGNQNGEEDEEEWGFGSLNLVTKAADLDPRAARHRDSQSVCSPSQPMFDSSANEITFMKANLCLVSFIRFVIAIIFRR